MRLLFWLVIGYCIYMILKGWNRKEIPPETAHRREETETHKDPVCGVYVAGDDAVVGNLEGKKIYFCSMECLKKYQEQLEHS